MAKERAEKAEKELLIKVNREITGQVSSKEKSPVAYVKNIQHYLENIIARLPGNVFWLNRDLVYLGCNDNGAKFLGLKSRKDIVGLTSKDFKKSVPWVTDCIDVWRADNLKVITTGIPMLNIESGPFVLSTGEELYYLTSRVPLFDDEGNIIGVTVVSMDISDRRKFEQLQKERGIMEKTSSFMRMLAGSIAHELRTPLAIISINADLLKTSPALSTADDNEKNKLEKCFKSIKHAIKLASHIIDNMLVVLKTLASGVQIKNSFKQLSMVESLQKILKIYPFLDHERSLITIDLDRTKDFFYQGDETLTQHILSNLISNSLHAIKEAEKGAIRISFNTDDKYNILKFTDTALGISEKELPEIFGQFASNKQLGAGLGLAFCKEVMQVYGGDINCKSRLGEYTEFTLKFPKILSKRVQL